MKLAFPAFFVACLQVGASNLAGATDLGFGALKLELEGSWEIQTDHVLSADDRDEELTNTEQALDLETALSFGESITIHSLATFDSVRDPEPGKSRFLKANDLHVDNLYLELEHQNLKLIAGKYDVAFGVAWDRAYGVYGTDLAEDYEIEKKIALGAEVTLNLQNLGEHTLSGSTFFSDTSILSDSVFTHTGRLRKYDGGLANTESFSSFALNLKGDAGFVIDDAGYNLAVSVQDGGANASHDQMSAAFALYGSQELTNDVNLEWLLESAYIANFEGTSTERLYTTASAKIGYNDVWLAPSVTHWVGVSGRGRDEYAVLATASIGVDLTENLEMAVGYAFFTETGEAKHVVGFRAELGF